MQKIGLRVPLHVFTQNIHKKQVLIIFHIRFQTTNRVLIKFAPNMYFESKYIREKLTRKTLKIKPYFGQNLPKSPVLMPNKKCFNILIIFVSKIGPSTPLRIKAVQVLNQRFGGPRFEFKGKNIKQCISSQSL